MTWRAPTLPLRARGIVGDRSTAALVAADATIDWYCPGRFDAPAACFRLLDPDGGAIGIELEGGTDPEGAQRYDASGAPVLSTLLRSADAAIEVADHLRDGRLVRIVRVRRGPAAIRLRVAPGWRFGRPRRVERWSRGITLAPQFAIEGLPPDAPVLLEAGDTVVVTVGDPAAEAMSLSAALDHERRVVEEWQPQLAEVAYDGPYRGAVVAAVRNLRLLTDRSSGAVAAAATTSLPVRLGNERNIDQRLAWLRENASVVWLWERLGQRAWADETREWLRTQATDELPLAPAYRTNGERPPTEIELLLPGWRGNGPVRVSNRAGEGLDLTGMAATALVLDARSSYPLLCTIGSWLAQHWQRPDAGRWDSRGRPQQWVASKLAVHRALVALARTAARIDPLDLRAIEWHDARDALGHWLRKQGRFGAAPHAGWRRTPGDESSDAAAIAWAFSAEPPELPDDGEGEASSRMYATLEQTLAQLSEGPFLHRHLPHVDDGFPPGQGPDLLASFHAISALCRMRRWDDAHSRMEGIVNWLHPQLIVPTHADMATGDVRGNLPAAAASAALITAALDLAAGPR